MADSTRVLTALRNELVILELVRPADTAGPLPPAFIEPKGGAPAPGEREGTEAGTDLTVTLRLSGELSEAPFDTYRRRIVADVLYRSKGNVGLIRGRRLDDALRDHVTGPPHHGLGFMLDATGPAATSVLQAAVFGGLGPVSEVGDIRTERAAYVFEVLAS